jgi:hypothetical protein
MHEHYGTDFNMCRVCLEPAEFHSEKAIKVEEIIIRDNS